MKILSIGGTRPQFIKMAVLVKAFDEHNLKQGTQVEHRLLHTGQHYDPMMSNIFFTQLGMPQPHVSLGINAGTPGVQTAAMLASIEASLINWKPDVVLIYGDTNSTLAAAIATVKLHIPLIHIESGLRSFNRHMQEEINRIVSDHVSDLLLCPTQTAVAQLFTEGLGSRAVFVGDVMLDAVEQFSVHDRQSENLKTLELEHKEYALVTVHRAENTDDVKRLGDIIKSLEQLSIPVILPVHPRLDHLLGKEGRRMLASHRHIHLIEPVGYFEMLVLQGQARMILTDSGGVQKEAYFQGVPCLTMRDETEWIETLHGGWNALVGTKPSSILSSVHRLLEMKHDGSKQPRNLSFFGDGHAGERSVQQILNFMRAA